MLFFNSFQLLPYKKISTIETRKNELKNQMKNSYQKILTTYKKGEQVVSLFTFFISSKTPIGSNNN